MKKILILQGNPKKDSLCGLLAKTYYEEAKKQYDVKLIEIKDLKFELNLYVGYKEDQGLEPDLKNAQNAILEAEHIVFIFPNWWSTMPALLKGFLDRVFLPSFAFKYRSNSPLPEKLLKGRSARIIITMDAPQWYYKWFNKAPGLNALKIGTLEFSGIAPVKSTCLGPVRKAPQKRIDNFIQIVKALGAKGL
ncbi:flavodoxin family protein [Leptospira ognonensis]|uniref:Flavodoxin family protein n=1 Tax=Leptospira ognonensis TaxID=2484945 RepID=A0A4R9JXU1_9LEPT|nr:NAD(P)H-dependent oxidoreductase [Leptospira ognonensis]TGL58031.1 flavodoxin family protein [Leptospira ognonensis]